MRSRSAVFAAVLVAAGLGGLGPPTAAAVPAGECGPMDVALVLDTTSSMSNAMNDIQAKIGTITAAVKAASGDDYRIGLITFSKDVQVHSQFVAGNKAAIDALVPPIDGAPGGANAEASDEAVHTAVRNLADGPARPGQTGDFTAPWRGHATKAVVLVTDALPAGFDDLHEPADLASADAAALAAADRGIKIHAIFPPDLQPGPVEVVMSDYAATTGGVFTETEDPSTADAIIAALLDCDRSDVVVRDALTDTGAEPQPALAQSPDIRLCAGAGVTCPAASTFTAAPGTTAFFHVRLTNPGPNGSGATSGTLKLYRSGSHENAQWPLQWSQIGTLKVTVPVGVKTVVIPWTTTVADLTFLTRWVSPTDPMTFAETSGITANVRNNNNVAWRRITVNPDPG